MTYGFMAVMKVEVLGNKTGLREVIRKQPGCCVQFWGCLGCYLCCCSVLRMHQEHDHEQEQSYLGRLDLTYTTRNI